ncbi:hypothetical protein B0T16DRAFT_393133 [Cercophora newfieldiana]|uniref:SnoaL-like domain-containing protein n=1 Tax=Cercophora newfieldiana TaxID=92897 RepID=A0AA39XW68_9PEZI|nr:hypothetical protein B0T16DRAFT_393133 [Cercophora newfieldiana]
MATPPALSNLSGMFDAFGTFVKTAGADPESLRAAVANAFAPDEIAAKGEGLQGITEFFLNTVGPPTMRVLDATKPVEHEVSRIISGGDGWTAVEFKEIGTTKSGTPGVAEAVLLVNSNADGKIADYRIYMDTHYVQKQFKRKARI